MKGLRLSDIAQVAEIIAAVAVVGSLVFVGLELRRNTAAVRASSFQGVVQGSRAYMMNIATDPSLAELMMADYSELEGVDAIRRVYVDRAFWQMMQNAFAQRRYGVLGNEWVSYRRVMCGASAATSAATWHLHRGVLMPEFVSFIESCRTEDS